MRVMVTVVGFCCFAGCGQATGPSNTAMASMEVPGGREPNTVQPKQISDDSEAASTDSAMTRHIIYTASFELVVEDFSAFTVRLRDAVYEAKGFVASGRNTSMRGESQRATWKLRVPAASYESFVAMLPQLGSLESQEEKASDVTEEFVDLEARILSKQKLETRILELLENSGHKIKDVIDVEQELARVRSEIERLQGRLRLLRDQTAFSTITIDAWQEREYTPAVAVPFTTRLSNAWDDSLTSIRQFFERSAIMIAGYGLPVAVVVLTLLLGRHVLRRRLTRSV